MFHQLIHHFNETSLADCFHELDGRKAVGADGVTKSQYGERLDENIRDLTTKMKRMAYRPRPVREVPIPKPNKPEATRPLGASNLEDKIVQKMMQKVLESIYEPIMLPCSYGFRPSKSCHDAIRALKQHLFKHEVETVIDVDISNFFGTLDRHMLDKMLPQKIGDQRLIRYIHRMFKAGILRANELEVDDKGVVQGSMCSPILANIYAHYVIDEWFEAIVKKHCKGRAELFRYADDAVICCRYQSDAERIKRALVKRLEKYNLRLNEDKTHCVPFSKRQSKRERQLNTFDFLGFTFYWGRSIRGAVIPEIKTSKQRVHSTLKALTQWIKEVKNRMKLRAYPKSSRAGGRTRRTEHRNRSIYRHIRGFRAPPDAVWRPRSRFRIGSQSSVGTVLCQSKRTLSILWGVFQRKWHRTIPLRSQADTLPLAE